MGKTKSKGYTSLVGGGKFFAYPFYRSKISPRKKAGQMRDRSGQSPQKCVSAFLCSLGVKIGGFPSFRCLK